MTAPLTPEDRAAIRARHQAYDTTWGPECGTCEDPWPCDTARVLGALDEAERTLDRVLTNYAVCVSGEWGSCLNPKRRGWAEFFAEFKAEALRVEDDPWWADDDEEEDE